MTISKRKLKCIMVNRGFTVAKLAQAIEMRQETISKIMRRNSCRMSTAIKLCQALNCTIEEIIPTEKEN